MKHSEQWWLHENDMAFAKGYQSGRDSAIKEYDEKDCICKGNWRSIVEEYEPLIGKKFLLHEKVYYFFGFVHGADDYYYGMSDDDNVYHAFSCVCNLKTYGFVEYTEKTKREQIQDRIRNYLESGGLWNPEAMEHDKVRDLLMDVRAFLDVI
jgi:hypothetical protein